MTAERQQQRPHLVIVPSEAERPIVDPFLLALAGLIRSAHENRYARRATLTAMDGGKARER